MTTDSKRCGKAAVSPPQAIHDGHALLPRIFPTVTPARYMSSAMPNNPPHSMKRLLQCGMPFVPGLTLDSPGVAATLAPLRDPLAH